MKDIVFTLHAHVAEPARERLLDWIRRLAGVETAGALRPDARSPAVRRMCFVRTRDEAAVDEVLEALRTSPEIEAAEPAAPRELPGGATDAP